MSQLGDGPSSNILIKEIIQTQKETLTTQNQRTIHKSKTTDLQLIFLYPWILPHQAHPLKQFLETTFLLPITTSAVNGISSVCEI